MSEPEDAGKYQVENQQVVQGQVIGDHTTVHQHFYRSASSASPARAPERVWNVPFPHNPFFTGREEILEQLHACFHTVSATALSQPQAMSGLGGIGKTQIAVEYAHRYHQDYQAVLWIRADTHEALVSGYVEIAQQLQLPQKDEQDQILVVKAIREWFKIQTQWLLILDNADDLALVREFLPPTFGGHILLTTRAQAMGRLAHRFEIETMDPDVGALLLVRRAGLVAPDTSLDAASSSDIILAREITQELGGLPLALDQAGAYIEETSCSLLDYQSLYRARRAELLGERGGLVDDHPESVATTWSLSFQKVEQGNPAAAELLRFCAFLHPDAIPEEIITAGAEHLGALLHLVARDPLALNKVIAALSAYSLVHRDVATKTLNVHRLVQAVLMDRMDSETLRLWAQRTVLAVSEAFPKVEFTSWGQCERCLPHALACATLIEQYHFTFTNAARLLSNTGGYLRGHAHYDEAEVLLQRALRTYENIAEPTYPAYGITLNELAEIYKAQSKYAQAVPLLQRALDLSEEHLEPDHLHMVAILVNLARNYREQGKYAEAEPLFLRALDLSEKHLGPDHPDTAGTLGNLAFLYQAQGKYAEAELLFLRALKIKEQALPPDDPFTAITLDNLAFLYQAQGKYAEAEPLFLRALKIKEQALLPNHPRIATTLKYLAGLYQAQGKYAEAEPLYQRALAIYEQALRPDHPFTVTTLKNYANLLRKMQRTREAVTLEQRASVIRAKSS